MVAVARRSYERGWVYGTAGNFSVRGAGYFWQSPSGVPKGSLNPRSFIPVNPRTAKALACHYSKPSDETPLHAAIYRQVAAARAVVHVHPPYLVKVTSRRQSLRFSLQEMQKLLGSSSHESELVVPVYPNNQDMVALSQALEAKLSEHPVLVLSGHGVYSYALDPEAALARIEALEFLCQTYYP